MAPKHAGSPPISPTHLIHQSQQHLAWLGPSPRCAGQGPPIDSGGEKRVGMSETAAAALRCTPGWIRLVQEQTLRHQIRSSPPCGHRCAAGIYLYDSRVKRLSSMRTVQVGFQANGGRLRPLHQSHSIAPDVLLQRQSVVVTISSSRYRSRCCTVIFALCRRWLW